MKFPVARNHFALALLGFFPAHAALAQGAVRDSVRELEEAESRLGGGIYQVPLPAAAGASEAGASKAGAGAQTAKKGEKAGNLPITDAKRLPKRPSDAPRGIDITPSGENGAETSNALAEVTARIAAIQEREGDLRARILRLQDQVAARLDDVGYANIFLLVKDPGPTAQRADQEPSGRAWPLGLQEIAANLDGVPLVSRFRPRRIEREMKVPLYEGPLPAGDYDLHLRLVVGLQAGPWPVQAGTGRWLIEDTLKFRHVPSRDRKGTEAVVVLAPKEGNTRPVLTLEVREDAK